MFVYRLRRFGQRVTPQEIAGEGIEGDLRIEPFRVGWHGRRMLIARLCDWDTSKELLPALEKARLIRVREALLLHGEEAVPRGRKSLDRYPQTWVCATGVIQAERWRALPREVRGGFDPADDDCPR